MGPLLEGKWIGIEDLLHPHVRDKYNNLNLSLGLREDLKFAEMCRIVR